MSVSNYLAKTEYGCRYNYRKLKDVIYLVSDEHLKNIHIDNGEAYIDGLTETPLMLDGFNIQFKEESSLDERYKFQKTLNISINGVPDIVMYRWTNIDINQDYWCEGGNKYYKQILEEYQFNIHQNFYLIIETMDGTFYMINVDFPSKMTYTYNLSRDRNQTDFTFTSLSNFPALKLNNFSSSKAEICKNYRLSGAKGLQMLEKDYANLSISQNKVISTEDFKTVEYLGETLSFQEAFDGENVTSTLEFQIAFDAYKSSWHYNLLEFMQNRYAAIIGIKNEENKIYAGFNYGLQPNYTINASTEQGQSDIITITLVETSINGSRTGNYTVDTQTENKWRYVRSVNNRKAYECVGNGTAKYLIQEECNYFGIPTGNYKVLEGYQSMFPTLHIVGTFSNTETFTSPECYATDAIYDWIIADITKEWICDDCDTPPTPEPTGCDQFITDGGEWNDVPQSGGETCDSAFLWKEGTPVFVPESASTWVTYELLHWDEAPKYRMCTDYTIGPWVANNLMYAAGIVDTRVDAGTPIQNLPTIVQDAINKTPGSEYAHALGTIRYNVAANNEGQNRTCTIKWKVDSDECPSNEFTITQLGGSTPPTPTCNCSTFAVQSKGEEVPSGASSTEITIGYYTGATNCSSPIKITVKSGVDFMGSWRLGSKHIYAKVKSSNGNPKVRQTYYYVTQGDCQRTLVVTQAKGPDAPTPTEDGFRWNYQGHETSYSATVDGDDTYLMLVPFYSVLNGAVKNGKMSSNDSWIITYDTSLYLNGNELAPNNNNRLYLEENNTGSGRTGTMTLTQKGSTSAITVTITQKAKTIECYPTSFALGSSEVCRGNNLSYSYTMNNTACSDTLYFTLFDANGKPVESESIPSGGSGSGTFAIPSTAATGRASVTVGVDRYYVTINDCSTPSTQYRWVDDGYTCKGYDKWQQKKEQISTDYGQTWTDTGVVSATTLIEANSEYCGYVPPTFVKFKASYSDGQTDTVNCNSNSTLTSGETKPILLDFTQMKSATIGNCVTTLGESVFEACTRLNTVVIPNTVTTIEQYAFYYCRALTSLNIPSSVTSIGLGAFGWCDTINSITINATTPPTIGLRVFDNTNNCPIYVPARSLNAYKTATNWSTYAGRIKPIS